MTDEILNEMESPGKYNTRKVSKMLSKTPRKLSKTDSEMELIFEYESIAEEKTKNERLHPVDVRSFKDRKSVDEKITLSKQKPEEPASIQAIISRKNNLKNKVTVQDTALGKSYIHFNG